MGEVKLPIEFLSMCGRGLDENKIVYSSTHFIHQGVLMRRYQFFCAIIDVYNMLEWGVPKYGL